MSLLIQIINLDKISLFIIHEATDQNVVSHNPNQR